MPNSPRWPRFVISSWLLIDLIVLAAVAVFTTSCTPKPPDVPVCEQLTSKLLMDENQHLLMEPSPACQAGIGEAECGHCVWIVSGKEQFVGEGVGHWLNGEPWSKVKAHSMYVPAKASYAPLADYIINSCKKMNCSSQVDLFKVKLDSLNGISDAAGALLP